MKKLILPVMILMVQAAAAAADAAVDQSFSDFLSSNESEIPDSDKGLFGESTNGTDFFSDFSTGNEAKENSNGGANGSGNSSGDIFSSKYYKYCKSIGMKSEGTTHEAIGANNLQSDGNKKLSWFAHKKELLEMYQKYKTEEKEKEKEKAEEKALNKAKGDLTGDGQMGLNYNPGNTNKISQFAPYCNAMAFYLNESKADTNKNKSKQKTVKSDAKSPLGDVECVSNGIDTIDYKSCANLLDAVSVATIAQEVGGQVADLNTQLKGNDLTSNLAAKPGEEFNAALKAQKESMGNVKENLTTKIALSGARFAAVLAAKSAYMERDELISKCANADKSKYPGLSSNICNAAALKFNLFPNQEAYEKITGILVKDGADIVKNTMVNNYLDKNMNSIDNLMNTVKTFNPMQPTAQELQMMKCQAQPTLPECQTMMNQSVDMVGTDAFTFGGGMGLTYNPGQTTEEDPFASNNNNGPGSVGNPLKPLGSAISPSGKKGGGLVAGNAPGVDSKLNSTSGSTGGGGGLGGGGGGGGAPAPKGDGGPSAANVPAVKSISYTGGDGINLTGGSGLRNVKRDEKSDGGNPFDSLFGKNKGGSNSGVTNFREPAALGAKNGDIFQMISNAYSRSDANGRLMKYELSN